MEEYKNIENLEKYQISNFGNVRNGKTGRILKGFPNTDGYLGVDFRLTSLKKIVKIHKLVAKAFLDNPEDKLEVDHIDNNKQNNNASNLRYATRSENMRNTKRHSNNKSGIKGVFWHNQSKKWRAEIQIDGIKIHLGAYNNIEDARQARITKVKAVFGEFVNKEEIV